MRSLLLVSLAISMSSCEWTTPVAQTSGYNKSFKSQYAGFPENVKSFKLHKIDDLIYRDGIAVAEFHDDSIQGEVFYNGISNSIMEIHVKLENKSQTRVEINPAEFSLMMLGDYNQHNITRKARDLGQPVASFPAILRRNTIEPGRSSEGMVRFLTPVSRNFTFELVYKTHGKPEYHRFQFVR